MGSEAINYMSTDAAIVEAIRKEVRAVVREELVHFLLELRPYVTDEEMQEIENKLGNPEKYRKEDFEEVRL